MKRKLGALALVALLIALFGVAGKLLLVAFIGIWGLLAVGCFALGYYTKSPLL